MKKMLMIICFALPLIAFADVQVSPSVDDVPVTDAATDGAVVNNLPSSMDKITLLQQQVAYLQRLSLPNKINQLEQSLQDLRRIVEAQGQELQQFEKQQKDFYNNVNQQITKLTDQITKLANSSQSQTTKQPNALIPPQPQAQQVVENSSMTQTAKQSNVQTQPQLQQPATNTPQLQSQAAPADKDTETYQQAIQLVKRKNYTEAEAGLLEYLKQYPKGQFAVNAYYWLGEIYAIAGESEKAEQAFQAVVKNYPGATKVPDALLKLATLAYDQSKFQDAQKLWLTIVNKYPGTSAARVASVRLQQ